MESHGGVSAFDPCIPPDIVRRIAVLPSRGRHPRPPIRPSSAPLISPAVREERSSDFMGEQEQKLLREKTAKDMLLSAGYQWGGKRQTLNRSVTPPKKTTRQVRSRRGPAARQVSACEEIAQLTAGSVLSLDVHVSPPRPLHATQSKDEVVNKRLLALTRASLREREQRPHTVLPRMRTLGDAQERAIRMDQPRQFDSEVRRAFANHVREDFKVGAQRGVGLPNPPRSPRNSNKWQHFPERRPRVGVLRNETSAPNLRADSAGSSGGEKTIRGWDARRVWTLGKEGRWEVEDVVEKERQERIAKLKHKVKVYIPWTQSNLVNGVEAFLVPLEKPRWC